MTRSRPPGSSRRADAEICADEVVGAATARARAGIEAAIAQEPELTELIAAVQRREIDPLTAVDRIVAGVLREGSLMTHRPSLDDINAARARLEGVARVTPLFSSGTIGALIGREVFLKAENLQLTGSFKIRGAYNTIAQLTEAERQIGVVTASAGNHGQAVAWAARRAGIAATIFVPEGAPMAKVDAARGYGAEVVLGGEGFDDAVAAARLHVEKTGATFVHAFDDPRVVAGQGTLGLELAEQLPAGPCTVVIPIGGGGLAAGIAIGLRSLRPELSLVGVQAAQCAPLAGRAPVGPTIADGIAVKYPAELTSAILRDLLDEVVVVEDEAISQAIVLLLERSKLVVEGAGAAPVAALLGGLVPGEGPVCGVLAGGNIDATTLDVGDTIRSHLDGALPRRSDRDPRSAGPARQHRGCDRGGARERARRSRTTARGAASASSRPRRS